MGRHGENIRKRKDGRWEARYIQSHNEQGKAKYRYLYGKSYQEVKEKRQILMTQKETQPGLQDSGASRFDELASAWLFSKKDMVKESTYAIYANILNRQLIPGLGSRLMSELTSEQLNDFLIMKRRCGRLDDRGGLSAKTVADIRAILNMILEYGQLHDYPGIKDVQLRASGNRPKQMKVLTKPEQEKLEKTLFSERSCVHLGILISLYAGLRIGEVCALQWKDFHFEDGTVTVSKTILRIQDTSPDARTKTKIIIEKPKTECSNRVIPLPEFVLNYFSSVRQADHLYLLTNTSRFTEPRTYLNQYKRVLRKAGLCDYNYHSLRHTFATRCIENGVDTKSLSEIMGHSNVTVTMQRYVHPSLELKREQINKLSSITVYGQNYGQGAGKQA